MLHLAAGGDLLPILLTSLKVLPIVISSGLINLLLKWNRSLKSGRLACSIYVARLVCWLIQHTWTVNLLFSRFRAHCNLFGLPQLRFSIPRSCDLIILALLWRLLQVHRLGWFFNQFSECCSVRLLGVCTTQKYFLFLGWPGFGCIRCPRPQGSFCKAKSGSRMIWAWCA